MHCSSTIGCVARSISSFQSAPTLFNDLGDFVNFSGATAFCDRFDDQDLQVSQVVGIRLTGHLSVVGIGKLIRSSFDRLVGGDVGSIRIVSEFGLGETLWFSTYREFFLDLKREIFVVH